MEITVKSKRNSFDFETKYELFKYSGTCTLNDDDAFIELNCSINKLLDEADVSAGIGVDTYVGSLNYSHPVSTSDKNTYININGKDEYFAEVYGRILNIVADVRRKLTEQKLK